MPPRDRDADISRRLSDALAQAADGKVARVADDDLDALFETSSWGFREIVLVTTIARLQNAAFTPSTDLYGCNPRALFEGPIRGLLASNRIPHRQSGPLNIAKAAKGLDVAWAAQRRPRSVADAVVRLALRLDRATPGEAQSLLDQLALRFVSVANAVQALTVKAQPKAEIGMLFDLCLDLIEGAPDRGNTAQRVVGYLLQAYHDTLATGIVVQGHEEAASVTSTTAKKPGDVREESAAGELLRVYEVTTKPFDDARATDASSALAAYANQTGVSVLEVVVICREDNLGDDTKVAEGARPYLGNSESGGVEFQFEEMSGWIAGRLVDLPPGGRLQFFGLINEYVDDPNTAEAVKKRWGKFMVEAGLVQV